MPRHLGYLSLLLMLVNFSGIAETLVWLKPNMPPYNIEQGDNRGQGRIDQVELLLQQALNEYQHQQRTASYPRILQDMVEKQNVCSASLLKDEKRAEFIEFSVPYMLGLSNRLVVNQQKSYLVKPFVNTEGAVNLDLLLQSKHFVLGIAADRKYGGNIDTILQNHLTQNSIYQRRGTDQLQGLIEMSLRGNREVAGFLSNPDQVMYLLEQKNISEEQFVFYQIQGNPPYLFGYMGCVKNDFGRAVISKANQLLLNTRSNVIADIGERWLDHGSVENYRRWITLEFGPR